MSEAPEFISKLIVRYITGQLNAEETMQLETWLESAAHHRTMFNRIIDPANRAAAWDLMNQVNPDRAWELLREQVPGLPVSYAPPAPRKHLSRLQWAAIIMVMVTLVTLWTLNRAGKKTVTKEQITETLPDSVHTATSSFNILQTPVGETSELELSDGTRVWLSAHSSLGYPAMFSGDQRLVELSGEAYFEVKRNNKPFVVKTALSANIVHGTTFIVKAYPGEASEVSTVITGRVTVKRGSDSVVLRDGQQTQVTKNNPLQAVNIRQPQNAAAWKQGYKKFTQATFAEILPALDYWHGYTAEGQLPAKRSTGTLYLKDGIVPLSRTLEKIFDVHITVDTVRRKLIITP